MVVKYCFVIKKNGQIQVCTDFRDLNLKTPQDKYVMPIDDMLVDVGIKHGVLTFIDDHSSYNQIFMVVEDVHETMFRCLRAFGYMKG